MKAEVKTKCIGYLETIAALFCMGDLFEIERKPELKCHAYLHIIMSPAILMYSFCIIDSAVPSVAIV
jgi:hypothetical protein